MLKQSKTIEDPSQVPEVLLYGGRLQRLTCGGGGKLLLVFSGHRRLRFLYC